MDSAMAWQWKAWRRRNGNEMRWQRMTSWQHDGNEATRWWWSTQQAMYGSLAMQQQWTDCQLKGNTTAMGCNSNVTRGWWTSRQQWQRTLMASIGQRLFHTQSHKWKKKITYNLLLHFSCKYFKNEWSNRNGRNGNQFFRGWVSWPKLQLEQKQGCIARGSPCWGRESESVGRNSKIGPACRGIGINLNHNKIVYWAAIEMVHN